MSLLLPTDLACQLPMSKKSINYCFTYNNWTVEGRQLIVDSTYKYLIMGKEVAPTTLTPHLQGFIMFVNARSLSSVIKDLPGCHVTACTGSSLQNIAYCEKENDWEEFGTRPMTAPQKGKASADKYKQQWDLAKEGNFAALPPAQIKVWEYIREKYGAALDIQDTEEEHLWYYGSTGTGKSRLARETNPNAYIKDSTKWWCGYNGEDVVIVEDIDQNESSGALRQMKIWADRYPFPAERKGLGSKLIRPRRIIVTSNYHPGEIWPSPTDHEPIMRRFKLVHFPGGLVYPKYAPNFNVPK